MRIKVRRIISPGKTRNRFAQAGASSALEQDAPVGLGARADKPREPAPCVHHELVRFGRIFSCELDPVARQLIG